jgi:hypothetical protein
MTVCPKRDQIMNSMYKHLLNQIAVNGENTTKWITASKKYFRSFIHSDPILKYFSEQIIIILHGSTTRNVDDAYSDLDFWLVLNDQEYDRYKSLTDQNFIPVTIDGKEGHINPLCISYLEKCFNNEIDMNLINEIRTSIVIMDKKYVFQKYQKLSEKPLSDPVKYAFFFYNYVMMRGYHRSCDNPMERGDEFAVLCNLMQTIRYGFQAAFVLDNAAYPYEKWLHIEANFHGTPKSLIEHVDTIITEIKSNPASLYGPESENKISTELRVIRAKLVEKAIQDGIDEPWLEKWYRYIDRSKEIIYEVNWA